MIWTWSLIPTLSDYFRYSIGAVIGIYTTPLTLFTVRHRARSALGAIELPSEAEHPALLPPPVFSTQRSLPSDEDMYGGHSTLEYGQYPAVLSDLPAFSLDLWYQRQGCLWRPSRLFYCYQCLQLGHWFRRPGDSNPSSMEDKNFPVEESRPNWRLLSWISVSLLGRAISPSYLSHVLRSESYAT